MRAGSRIRLSLVGLKVWRMAIISRCLQLRDQDTPAGITAVIVYQAATGRADADPIQG